jgi:prepilin-type N-terminal cleavage/methylation domain-containing protein
MNVSGLSGVGMHPERENKPGNGVDKGSLRGFTLIELAIVLVVIGLVVGGVLVGRDLIGAATMRAQLSQIEQLNTGVATFRDKYGGIPGDLPIPLANQFGFLTPTDVSAQPGAIMDAPRRVILIA